MVIFGADMSQFEKGLRDMDKELKKAEKSLLGFKQIGTRMADMGKTLTMGLTLPIVGIATAATKMGIDFNAAMANVGTLIPGNVQRVQELKKAVQDTAIAMGKSTADMADGLYQVVSAFGDSADTAGILEISAKAAAAGLATTTEAINLISAVTKGYGDTSLEAMRKTSDLAFTTVKLGQTTFPELAASIGRVTPLAATLGVEVSELFAGFATLTGVTGGAAEVSTQMRAILTAMMKPTKEMAAAIKSLGFNTAQSMVEQLGMTGALRALMGTTNGTQEAAGKLFGQVESLTAVFALTGGQADVFDSKMNELRNSTGATDRAFKDQTEGVNALGFQWKQAQQTMAVAAQTLGDALAPTLERATENHLVPMTNSVKNLSVQFLALNPTAQNTIIAFAGIAAATGPLLIGLGNFMILLPKIKAGLIAIKAVLTGPAGLIALVGVGLYMAFTNAAKAAKDLDHQLGEEKRATEELDSVRSEMARLEAMYPREALEGVAEYSRLLERERTLTDNLAHSRERIAQITSEQTRKAEAEKNRLEQEVLWTMSTYNTTIADTGHQARRAAKETRGAADAADDYNESLKKTLDTLKKLNQVTADAMAGMATTSMLYRVISEQMAAGGTLNLSADAAVQLSTLTPTESTFMSPSQFAETYSGLKGQDLSDHWSLWYPTAPGFSDALRAEQEVYNINVQGSVVSERDLQDVIVNTIRRVKRETGDVFTP